VLANWPGFLPHQRLNLGLDLQGGSSLLYEVDIDALKKQRLADLGEEATQELRDAQIQFQGLTTSGGVVALKINDVTQMDQAQAALGKVGAVVPGAGPRSPSRTTRWATSSWR
jgi:preprotein translocase subunit SecD